MYIITPVPKKEEKKTIRNQELAMVRTHVWKKRQTKKVNREMLKQNYAQGM